MPMSCVINAGRRHVMIPGWGIEITSPSAAAVAIQWYLSGGIAAANCIAAYTPKGAASLAASYDNNAAPGNGLADGTYDAAPGVAPTWNATNGWIFNGSTQNLNTGVVPQSDQDQTMIAKFTNWVGDGILASSITAWDKQLQLSPGRLGVLWFGNGRVATTAGAFASGTIAVAGSEGYKNGAAVGVSIVGWGGGATQPVWIGCDNNAGTLALYGQFYCQAFAIYDTTLTAPQVAAVSAAMAAL